MKIAINLVGVSYNDGLSGGRYRNWKDAHSSFMQFIVNPLRNQGHTVNIIITSYSNEKEIDIIADYQPISINFINDGGNSKLGGGDKTQFSGGMKLMSDIYIASLSEVTHSAMTHHIDYDVVISTRFDQKWFKNPFIVYDYDFTKVNFLWREPEYHHLPLVNDTFIVFPFKMTSDMIRAIYESEINPYEGISIGMHNIYRSISNIVGTDSVKWLDDRFVGSIDNDLYILTRHE